MPDWSTITTGLYFLLTKKYQVTIFLAAIAFLLSSCFTQQPSPEIYPSQTPENTATPLPPSSPTNPPASPTPTPPDLKVWIDPGIPPGAAADIKNIIPYPLTFKDQSSIQISTAGDVHLGDWYYALAAPFPSSVNQVNLQDLRSFWETGQGNFQGPIHISETTLEAFSLIWGKPFSESIQLSDNPLAQAADWTSPESLAIVPLDNIDPRIKLVKINSISPLEPDALSSYPLKLPIYYSTQNPELLDQTLSGAITNFFPDHLTRVAITGVTALVRDTAAIMEEKGILYPAGDIQSVLKEADLTHISNEVPFAEDCPAPDSNQESLYFCSRDEYIGLLEAVGTDIVELSGDHFGDWGPEAMLHTISLYEERGWLYYGGGSTLENGLQPVLVSHNGNQLAFIGCNAKAHDQYATATDTEPGASRCDFPWMTSQISSLASQGYLVIATMQHEEVDSFSPIALQVFDFHNLADAGAVVVSGSQAHHPQTIEVTDSSFIHYGLGNLFFDQWYLANYNPDQHLNKDKALIDIHAFYQGKHINTELIPLQFIDNARPRIMTETEAADFFQDVFSRYGP